LDTDFVNYTEWPECNCRVHRGFYVAHEAVRDEVMTEVIRLEKQFSSYSIKVTGHSLGAVHAHFIGMSLIKEGLDVSMINFG
jgi:hypothetical protein